MMNATAVTSVFWDIGSCPVPADFDARRVGPCIKRFLEKSGYSGPLTIRAIGRLTDFPLELLQTLSSTGIILHMAPYGTMSVHSAMFGWNMENKPPANVMVITDPTDLSFSSYVEFLSECGYNIILPYPFCPAECNIFWQHFLLAEPAALEEDKCIETSASPWLCTVCFGPPGQVAVTGEGFESFSTHISSQEHKESFLEFITPPSGSDEDYEYEEAVGPWSENSLPGATLCGYSRPAYAPTMVMHQPEAWQFAPLFATPSEHPRYVTTMGMIQPKSENSLAGATLCGYSRPAYAPTMVMHQPEAWQFAPLFATPSEHPRYVTTTMGMIQPKSENSLAGATLCGYSRPAYAPTMVMHQPEILQFAPLFATPSEHPRYVTTMGMIQPEMWQFSPLSATTSEYHGKYEPEGKRKRERV